MKHYLVAMWKGALCAAGISSCLLISTPAAAQIEIFPPAAFIATSSPVYFEGHAAYWYNDQWYYRDGPAWRHYSSEPTFLRDYRGRHEPVRQYYGRGHEGGLKRR